MLPILGTQTMLSQAGFLAEALNEDDLSSGKGDSPRMSRPRKYPDELIRCGTRLALESERPIAHIAHDLEMHPETLRKRVRGRRRPMRVFGRNRRSVWSGGDQAGAQGELRVALREMRYSKRRASFSRPSSTQTSRSDRVYR